MTRLSLVAGITDTNTQFETAGGATLDAALALGLIVLTVFCTVRHIKRDVAPCDIDVTPCIELATFHVHIIFSLKRDVTTGRQAGWTMCQRGLGLGLAGV